MYIEIKNPPVETVLRIPHNSCTSLHLCPRESQAGSSCSLSHSFLSLVLSSPSSLATSSPGPGGAWRAPHTCASRLFFLYEVPPDFLPSQPWTSCPVILVEYHPRTTNAWVTRGTATCLKGQSHGSRAGPPRCPQRVYCISSASAGPR